MYVFIRFGVNESVMLLRLRKPKGFLLRIVESYAYRTQGKHHDALEKTWQESALLSSMGFQLETQDEDRFPIYSGVLQFLVENCLNLRLGLFEYAKFGYQVFVPRLFRC